MRYYERSYQNDTGRRWEIICLSRREPIFIGDCGASVDAIAYEARRRGYDVEALPNSEEYRWGKNGEYTSPLEAWFSIIKFTENGSWKGLNYYVLMIRILTLR